MGIEWPKLVDTIALMQLAFSFATFAFFAAKHQSRVVSFSVERGDAFYTIYIFYTAIICVGPRSGCFRAGGETGAYPVGEPQSGGYNYVLRQGGLVKNLVWDVK